MGDALSKSGSEDAILVGKRTALKDNPSLTVRHCVGKNPVRIVIDNDLLLPGNLNLFDNTAKTLVFNSVKEVTAAQTMFLKIDFSHDAILQILTRLFNLKIQSVIVEGGLKTHESFIAEGFWDEAYRFVGNRKFENGVQAPQIPGIYFSKEKFDNDLLFIYRNFAIV
jgi:diaminohydroxyphosphoribosylaminopyrimidine deaminase/5-amino-6-(5-phosphoribosylamino)uracil reductase